MVKPKKFKRIEGVESETPIPTMIFSFLYALVFGASTLFPWMTIKDFVPDLALVLGMENSRATGAIHHACVIICGILSFSLFCLLWHKFEKNFSHKRCIRMTLIGSVIALAIGAVALVGYTILETMIVPAQL